MQNTNIEIHRTNTDIHHTESGIHHTNTDTHHTITDTHILLPISINTTFIVDIHHYYQQYT